MTHSNVSQDRPVAGLAIRLFAIAVLSSMFALVKYVGEQGVHVIEILFYRYLFGAVLTGGWTIYRQGFDGFHTKRFGGHALRAAFGIVAMGMNFWAVIILQMAEAATIGFTVPLIATVFSVIFLSEFVGIRRWAAVSIGFLGILIAIQPWQTSMPLFGACVALAGATFGAVTMIIIRRLGSTETSTSIVFYYTILAVPIVGIGMFWVAQPHSWDIIGLLLLIGFLGTIGQLGLSESLRLANVAVVMPMDYSNLIFATAIGFVFWQQLPQASLWLGAPLIIGSGIYIALRERKLAKTKTLSQDKGEAKNAS